MPTPYEYQVRGKKAYLFKVQRPDTGKRTTLRLGVVSKTIAKEIGLHIDKIQSSVAYQLDLPPETRDWLSRIDNKLYGKFVAVGLLKERIAIQVPRLKSFLTAYCESHYNTKTKTGQWKTRSYTNRMQCVGDLAQYFGPDRKLSDISHGDAADWFAWLQREVSDNPKAAKGGRGLARATASKRMKDARQMFTYAVRKKLLSENPFDGIRIPLQDNPERLVEVPRSAIDLVIQQTTDPEFRLILMLARVAGLRVPSETSAMTWGDVNFEEKKMIIRAAKTQHHAHGGIRSCPLFEDLVPFFRALRKPGCKPTDHVFVKHRDSESNLRTELLRLIKKAGVTPWTKPFQNLRANALTDLCDIANLPQACKWIGNSPDVAMRHYLIIKKKDWEAPGSKVAQDATKPTGAKQKSSAKPGTENGTN